MTIRNYNELSDQEKNKVLHYFCNDIIGEVIDNAHENIYFEPLFPFKDKIDHVITEMERLRTPWFEYETMIDVFNKNNDMQVVLNGMALEIAEKAKYRTSVDLIINLDTIQISEID